MSAYDEKLRADADTLDDLNGIHEHLKGVLRVYGPAGKNLIPAAAVTDLLQDVAKLQEKFAPEEIEAHVDPAEDGCAAVGRLIMGGLVVALTRSSHDGKLMLLVESEMDGGTEVRIELQTGHKLWEGKVD
jgi:hypothetical protein